MGHQSKGKYSLAFMEICIVICFTYFLIPLYTTFCIRNSLAKHQIPPVLTNVSLFVYGYYTKSQIFNSYQLVCGRYPRGHTCFPD